MEYFNIDSETLQSKTDYDPEDSAYEYRPMWGGGVRKTVMVHPHLQ